MVQIKKRQYSFEIISAGSDWDRLLINYSAYDFAHTRDFHVISQMNGEGEPILFSIKSGDSDYVVLWPALKRSIPNTKFFDLGCVYGYGGPLISPALNPDTYQAALECLFDGMQREGYISLFSRMHPLFTHKLPKEFRGEPLSEVVVIDVVQGLEDILVDYRAGHRYEIKKSFKLGIDIFIDANLHCIDDFYQIYQSAMKDLGASSYYFFDLAYFKTFRKSKDFKVFTIFAVYEGKKIAAAMFIVTKTLMQYFLSGTLAEYRKFAASKAIVAKAHEIAKDLGVKYIVLGGGVGSKHDALFEFKKGFSKHTEDFCVLKKIFNPHVYEEICAQNGIVPRDEGFFPAYRSISVAENFVDS